MKKICWIAKQYRKGWRLGIADNQKKDWLDFWFPDPESVSRTIRSNIVFIHGSWAKGKK